MSIISGETKYESVIPEQQVNQVESLQETEREVDIDQVVQGTTGRPSVLIYKEALHRAYSFDIDKMLQIQDGVSVQTVPQEDLQHQVDVQLQASDIDDITK